MATIVTTPAPDDRGDSSAGWAISVVVLLVIIAGIAFWYMRYRQAPVAQDFGATIQADAPASGQGGGTPAPAQ